VIKFTTRIRGGYQCLRCGHITTTRQAIDNHISRWSPACGQPLSGSCFRCGRQLADHIPEGHRFAAQPVPLGPIHDCASLGGSHQPDCQLALARNSTLGQPGDFDTRSTS
jgi:hypothetical protein